jgi:hypothetical protein
MSDNNPQVFTITTITRGLPIAQTSKGFVTQNFDASGNTREQLWLVEKHPEHTNLVAFKNVGTGQYMRCAAAKDYGDIGPWASAWYWALEKGDAPGAYW